MKSIVEQMSFYAAYHRNPMNKAIHFVCVPTIVWSLMVLLSATPGIMVKGFPITAALGIAVVLVIYYLVMDVALGIATGVLFAGLLYLAWLVASHGWTLTLYVFIPVFVVAWIGQIVGHKVFEKRNPAFLDNLFQVFVAPIFVMTEWFFAFGLKKKLHRDVQFGMAKHLPKAMNS